MSDEEANRTLIERAARASGVATETDLRDYFRSSVLAARTAIAHLVESGVLQPVIVEGWKPQAYLHAAAHKPRSAKGTALLSPFDSLVWNRDRLTRLFGFHYRIEIYTPAHKRVHGYYVLPYLMDGDLVARVDLKADRASRRFTVHAVHYEPGVQRKVVLEHLRTDLASMAQWLELDIVQEPRSPRHSSIPML